MKHILSDRTVGRIVKYGVNVFGIDSSLEQYEIARYIAVNEGLENAYVPLSEQDILDILKASL